MPKQKINNKSKRVRYAVVGLGYISQIAVLPAFRHASENSEIAALVSGDPVKLKKLSKKYNVSETYSYEQFDQCLESADIDAVYIALPNHLHSDYTIRSAKAGKHVLCEKPMAITKEECESMIEATEKNKVKLMIAYRLHFEKVNMTSVQIAKSGKIGDLRFFNSVFSMQVKEGDIRLRKETGGGTLYDIGIYCINAARYFFRDEPLEVFALSVNNGEKRFRDVDEATSVIMKFPEERLATFTSSFGASDVSSYRLIGTKGEISIENAYEYAETRERWLITGKNEKHETFEMRDQFAPELAYFSDCILKNKKPDPSGREGMADVAIIQALYESSVKGRPVYLKDGSRLSRPSVENVINKPPVRKPDLINARAPHD